MFVLFGSVNEVNEKLGILRTMIPISTISRPVEIGLRLTGIWPNSLVLFRMLWTLVMGIVLIFQYHYLLIHFSTEELPNLIDGLSTTLPYNLLFIKMIVLWVNNRIFNDVLKAMSNDWREYSGMYAMIDKAVLAHRCSKLTIGVYSTAVLLYSTASINFRKQSNDSCRELLIKMELPFNFCESPVYEIVMWVQFVHLMAVASSIGMLDGLMVTLMLHIGGQIDLMRQEVEEICPNDDKYDLPITIVRSLINKHQKIIAFTENIESLFSHIALMQFFSNTIIICCIGFLIVTSMGTDEGIRMLIKTMFFYIAITLEAFIFCFAGEYLSNKSKTIGDAVYESVWYNLKPRDCRVLLFVIMRSQKRLTITAGKFMELSLQGFTNSMKASASYVSVLYAMY
ncbi:odorant receptor 82a [Solenopsis invicta]|uniref:odorant receptor 82a n=1 Tax=Solenopsis invicta TaxID=13686 RepID=UPI00193D3808|nr:odorant receptor 82a [Solenopsis invicta]